MRILLINNHYTQSLGGSEIVSHLLAEELQKQGFRIVYGAVNGFNSDLSFNYEVRDLTSYKGSLHRAISKDEFDVVYWNYNKKSIWPNFYYFRKLNLKVIWVIHNINDLTPFSKKKSSLTLLGLMKRYIKNVFNLFTYNYSRRLVNGYVAINPEHLNLMPDNKPKAFIANGVPTMHSGGQIEEKYILWISNLKKVKNPEHFYQLSQSFKSRNIKFFMIGRIQEPFYKEWVLKTKNSNNFRYLGELSIEETNNYIRHSEFLVHTCDPEGFPTVFLQAWSFGKPTVSMNYDPSNTIQANGLGFYSRKSFDKFVQQVQSLIDDKSLYLEFSRNCKEYVEKNNNVSMSAKDLLKFLEEIT